ncbi:hypothetical protein CBR_g44352 [Chara braunii]|uniref:Peptidase A1 domain-containing protein n=1 Tax=Chara braunii TaxID=69332 RepID=A0A388K353_CHABU|nr:hypothetical protein CBR_g44352 [Chara braunii]|eukprot:GBG64467.1 hypothetical protein CBR_g44352 [Chara braunii]
MSSSLSSPPTSLTSTPVLGGGSSISSTISLSSSSSGSNPFAPPLSSSSSSSSYPSSDGYGASASRVSTHISLRDDLKIAFTVDVMMGTPAQTRSLHILLDDYITWTFCDPAIGSLLPQPQEAFNPPFKPASSTSYSLATCQSPGCTALKATWNGGCDDGGTSCSLRVTDHVDGIAGELVSELVMLKGEPLSGIKYDSMACVTEMEGSYVNFSGDGVLALGPGSGTFFATVTQQLKLPDILSVCFNATGYRSRRASAPEGQDPTAAVGDDSGSVVFGTPPWIVYPNLSANAHLDRTEASMLSRVATYRSFITGWSILPPSSSSSSSSSSVAAPLPPPGNGAVFFGSSFLTFMPNASLALITDAIYKATLLHPLPQFEDLIVYSQPSCGLSSFPVITFLFEGGTQLEVKPEEYTAMEKTPSTCLVSLGFAEQWRTDYTLLGLSVLQSRWLTFDFSEGPYPDNGVFKIGTGPCSGAVSK